MFGGEGGERSLLGLLSFLFDQAQPLSLEHLDTLDCIGPFGGLTVLLGGDFRQIPPVIPRLDAELLSSYCLRSADWWTRR